jgi:hypothetical protein
MITPAPVLQFSNFAISVIFDNVAGFRPTSISVDPRNSLLQKMSRSMFKPNEMLVAPKKAIFVELPITAQLMTYAGSFDVNSVR